MEQAGFLCSPGLQPFNIFSPCSPLISQVSVYIPYNHFQTIDAFLEPTGWRRLQARGQENPLTPNTEQTNCFHTAFLLLLRVTHSCVELFVLLLLPFIKRSQWQWGWGWATILDCLPLLLLVILSPSSHSLSLYTHEPCGFGCLSSSQVL